MEEEARARMAARFGKSGLGGSGGFTAKQSIDAPVLDLPTIVFVVICIILYVYFKYFR
jgi:hypothetical protein